MLAFEKSEYAARIAKTKTAMAEHGIDVLLCVDPANMCYLTGYDGWSFYVHQLVILAADALSGASPASGLFANHQSLPELITIG